MPVGLSLRPSLIAAIDALAAEHGVSRSEMIRRLVHAYYDSGVWRR